MPNNRVPCKFFIQGGCLKGESCAFTHDQTAPSYNICSFYQKGACSFGSRCRNIHVNNPITENQSIPTLDQPSLANNHPDNIASDSSVVIQKDQPICSLAASGNSLRGQLCPNVHGDRCLTCGKHCLHPFRPQEREEHFKACNKQKKQLEVLNRSQEVECSVCYERVLSKTSPAERKFGILSECDHPFCISCIRNWRRSSSRVMDVNSVLRACPICRKVSYFVIPSGTWYSTKEEKAEIVNSYKKKLRSIDCKYFDSGNGGCPFGSSCFYRHIVKEGSNLWNAALMPDLFDPNLMNCDETDWLSDGVDEDDETDILTIIPHSPLQDEGENYSLEDELNNAMASVWWLSGMINEGDSSSESSSEADADLVC